MLASVAAGLGAAARTAPPPEMHAPDGFLSVPIAAGMWAATLVVLAVAVRKTNRSLDERAIPLMGVMAAFIFAAQMFNFQVIGGTSGHLLGGVLAAVLLGPWAGTLVMACVIAVQALVFQDGGLVVMGANIFNMGVVGTLGGYAVYRIIASAFGGEARARIPAAAVAGWVSVVAGAALMAIELSVSGTTTLAVAIPAMVGVHSLIGIGEALITAAAIGFVAMTRADLLTAARCAGALGAGGLRAGDRGARIEPASRVGHGDSLERGRRAEHGRRAERGRADSGRRGRRAGHGRTDAGRRCGGRSNPARTAGGPSDTRRTRAGRVAGDPSPVVVGRRPGDRGARGRDPRAPRVRRSRRA